MAIDLWGFQAEDVDKLAPHRSRLDASEMGTGKTYKGAILDVKACADDGDNTLVIAQNDTLGQWEEKLLMADIPSVRIDPKDRNGSFERFLKLQGGAFLVHWEALRLMPWLRDPKVVRFTHGMADEIHRAQNRKAQQTQALKRIPLEFKTALGATPITGSTDKYWSVLNWLYPKQFGSYWKYIERYTEYDIVYPQGYRQYTGPKNEAELLERVEPWYVRHLKKKQCCPHHPEGVMPWLPDKYYTEVKVDLTPQQRKVYNQMRDDMLAWVGAQEDKPLPAPIVVAQLARLQQFAVAYAEVGPNGQVYLSEPSAKLDAVMQILEENPDEQIAIFSQFEQPLQLLAARLNKKGISFGLYTGQTRKTREEDKARFIRGDIRVLAGTIASGGVGVDGLQEASHILIFIDRLWSPALNDQAEDRLWRGGQMHAVQIIDIMARDTIDAGRFQRLETKKSWIRKVLGDK